MKTNNKPNENFNELVFENRNKEYGAYELRTSYNENVSRSLLITCTFFGVLTLLGVIFSNNKVELPPIITDSQIITLLNNTEVILQPKEKPKVDVEKPKEIPRTDNGEYKPEDDKVKGNDKINDALVIAKNANPNGKSDSVAKDPIIIEKIFPPVLPPVVTVPDKMPDFPDMIKFIADNLHYPQIAIENFTSGTVYLTFVVELDGSVSDVKTLKGIGDGCEQEAIRVVKKMPHNWVPGISKGKPVRSQCNLPIKFRIK